MSPSITRHLILIVLHSECCLSSNEVCLMIECSDVLVVNFQIVNSDVLFSSLILIIHTV